MSISNIPKDEVEERVKAIFAEVQFTQTDPTQLVEWALEARKEHGTDSPVSTLAYEDGDLGGEMFKHTPPTTRVTYEERNVLGGEAKQFIAVTLLELIH
ncbi:hypothetical protein CDES_07460 [Corynebacterium deserti GIMN1.010]|uniref:Uncharacterized protein n=1 Tax=Corynebacterium deserti GIMN1.010 TaxID=931089 RepID=A0A0M4CJG5_9CORY|nr:hypothetical protein [Corynebacterium deserti]ALC05901.1 hypothetical protein CDES_07460 [Corynebacterium deserti GIMN1.010]